MQYSDSQSAMSTEPFDISTLTPSDRRRFLRTDEGADWAYRRWLEHDRRYEPVAVAAGVHYNTIRKAVRRGAARAEGDASSADRTQLTDLGFRPRFRPSELREMARLWAEEELSFYEIGHRFNCSATTPARAVRRFLTEETRERVLRERAAPVL